MMSGNGSNIASGLQVGVRVVRGPDWKWSKQDDGEGHLGTVIEIGRPGSRTSPDKTVVVQWDSGHKTNYRVGYQASYDLRLFDNAPAGVRHDHICDECKQQGIAGIRWKCSKCFDYDLCSPCYNAANHDLSHSFIRFTAPNSKGIKVSKRQGATQIEAKGIFPNAKVERGPAWEWGNQDGGDGKLGRVIDIRGWDTETERSVANVIWAHAATNVYRLGHKGKADLKYRTAASGGMYYKDHLPVLGEPTEQMVNKPCPFKVGNKVKVEMDAEVLKAMQEGHGGWNPKMAEYIGRIGTVHRITDKGDIRVQYEGCSNRWTFHPGALTKIQTYNVGDAVMIINDEDKVMRLQKDHGEWTESMRTALGKVGKVVKVYSDGDLRVSVNSQVWTFNPECCIPRPQDQQQIDNTTLMEDTTAGAAKSGDKTGSTMNRSGVARNTGEPGDVEQVTTMLDQIMSTAQDDANNPDSLVREAVLGHLEVVKTLIETHPEQVNNKSAGKTALQVASHQGNTDVIKLLLEKSADTEIEDGDCDTALHYSAFGNQPDVMRILLEHGAKINAVNAGGCSALHVAVNKQHIECVKVLLENSCDVNIQDTYGDSAQHDAIGKDNQEIVTLLTEHPQSNFELQNKRGFNALHHSALKGNAFAAEKILEKTPDMVNNKKSDGFSALHLAALNGHVAVAETLLEKGSADIEIRNNRKQTPLMLAVTQGHYNVVELLINRECRVNAEDEDGDTPLHLAFFRENHTSSGAKPAAGAIGGVETSDDSAACSGDSSADQAEMCVKIIKYLAENGADVSHKDNRGRTPLDLVTDKELKIFLEQFRKVEEPMQCIVCDDETATVEFQPCGHKIVCFECSTRMKKCLTCQEKVERKIDTKGLDVVAENTKKDNDMEKRVQELEETLTCAICLDRRRNIIFFCGHSACHECAHPLRQCHMCRKPITKRINFFT